MTYTFTKIDVSAPVSPYAYISVDGVDASGEAVGNYGNVDGLGDGTFHGFIVEESNATTFDPATSSNTDIAGITPTGEIFGDYVDYANKQHGFVVNNGVVTTIDVFLANSTTVFGVAESGLIFGSYADGGNEVHGFFDNNGVFTQFDVPGAASTSIFGINAAGTVVGSYTDAALTLHGFVDSNGTFTTIDPQGSIYTSVVGISDDGEIAGNYQDISNNAWGFVDNNGVISNINIAGATSVGVSAINAAGEVVGYYTDSGSNVHGFIDDNGVITMVDVPGASQTDILGISATGVISGYFNDASGQHGFVGSVPTTVIATDGSTSLVQVGDDYFLDNTSTGTGPELMYDFAPFAAGQWGAWAPIGAEITATGYEVAFKYAGADLYSVWNTDSNGNIATYTIGAVQGNSPALEAAELSFNQDLNGDGVIGIPGTIESFGATSLVQVGNHYFLDGNSTGTGPEVMLGGAPVTVGEFPWTPIAGEQTSSGYEIALKDAATGQYTVWDVDTNGNVTYDPIGSVSSNSVALESLEPSFQQDLNGDGVIGILVGSSGSTNLVEVGNDYFLDSTSTGTGPELMYGFTPWAAGQWGAWEPIGAQTTATGYEVAFKYEGADLYTVWNTDSYNNLATDTIGEVQGNSPALEAAELSFNQDLNSDGVIGIPGSIESFGATSLVQAANHYFLDSNTTGTGPEVMLGGAPVTVGEFPWTPIAGEQTSSGYEIALKDTATGQYTVWNVDTNGNVTYDPIGSVSGNSAALEALEPSFHQDLNGDGVIGQAVPAGGTLEVSGGADFSPVEFMGPTGTLILDNSSSFGGQLQNFTGNGNLSSSDHVDLKDIAFGPGTAVGYFGTSTDGTLAVIDAQNHTAYLWLAGDYTNSTFTLSSDGSGGTTVIDPVVKQDTADGTLSFSDPDPTDSHSVSVSLHNGSSGYLGSFVADAVNAANGQDTVGWHFNFGSGPVTQTVTQSYDVSVADHHADGTTSTTSQSVTVTIAGPGNDAFVFHPGIGAETIVNAGSSDTIELDGFSSVTSNNQLATLLHDAQTGQPQSLFQSVNGGHDTLINLGNHDSVTLTGVHVADLHASNFIIH